MPKTKKSTDWELPKVDDSEFVFNAVVDVQCMNQDCHAESFLVNITIQNKVLAWVNLRCKACGRVTVIDPKNA